MLVISIAALNTGNNLLFIVIAAMLAGIIVSGAASAWMLRGIAVSADLPQHVFAGERVLGRLRLRNRRRLPAFSVALAPPKARSLRRFLWERSIFAIPKKDRRAWLRLPDISLKVISERGESSAIFSQREYFSYLPAQSSTFRDVHLRFPRRGRYAQREFGLSTRFPFCFLIKTRRVGFSAVTTTSQPANGSALEVEPGAGEIIVYPAVEPTDQFFEVLPFINGEMEAYVRGRGHDLYRIREYLPGDSARHVDWKATARTGNLQVREFTQEDQRKLRIVFDNPPRGAVSETAYEQAIVLAASLGWHFFQERAEISFTAPELGSTADVHEFLRYLALAQPASGDQAYSAVADLPVDDAYNIVLTASERGNIPTALWERSYFVFFSGMGVDVSVEKSELR